MLTPRHITVILSLLFALHAKAQQPLSIVQDRVACTTGLQDENGKWVGQQFRFIRRLFETSTPTDRYVYSDNGSAWGLLNSKTGAVLTPPIYSHIYGDGSYGPYIRLMLADSANSWGVINRDGNVVVPLRYQEVQCDTSEKVFWVKEHDVWGLRNATGEVLTAPAFQRHEQFRYGYAIVGFRNETKDKYAWNFGAINTRGEITIPLEYSNFQEPLPGAVPMQRNGNWGFVDYHNTVTILFTLPRIKKCWQVPQYHAMNANHKHGIVGQDGYWQLQPLYDSLSDLTLAHTAIARLSKAFFFVDSTGAIIKGTVCDSIAYTYPGIGAARRGKKWGLLDRYGEWLLPAQYEACGAYSNSLNDYVLWGLRKGKVSFFSYTPGQHGCSIIPPGKCFFSDAQTLLEGTRNLLIDRQGKILFGPTDNEIEKTRIGLRLLDQNMAEGLVRTDGRMIIPVVYAHVGAPTDFGNTDFSTEEDDGFLYAQTRSGKYAAYDTSGKMIIDSVWNDLSLRDSLTGCRLARTGRRTVIPRDMMRPIETWEHSCWWVIDAQGKAHATSANLRRPKFYGDCVVAEDSSSRQLHAFHVRTMKEITKEGYAEIIPYDAAHLFVRTGFFGKITDTSGNVVYDSICNISQPLNGYCMAVSSRLRYELIDKQFKTVGDTSVDGPTQFPFYLSAFFFPKSAPGDTVYRDANACVLPRTSVPGDIRRMATNQLLIYQIASVALRPAETTPGTLHDPNPPKSFIGYDSSTVSLEAYTDSTFTLATYRREGDNYTPLIFTTHDNYAFDRSGNIRVLELKNLFRSDALATVRDLVIKKVNAVAPKDFVMDCSRPDALPWSNFSILSDRLVIRIGSQDPGMQLVTVELPYTELKAVLDPKGPLGRMAK